MKNRTLRAAGIAAAALTGLAGPLTCLTVVPARAAQEHVILNGTIVSVRGSIYEIRPSLRPKRTRVSVDENTTILTSKSVTKDSLKPGMNLMVMGTYTEKDGLHPMRITASDKPIPMMFGRRRAFRIDKGRGFAFGPGILKSVEPFVFTDESGVDHTGVLDHVRDISQIVPGDRSELLIGVRTSVEGTLAGDGVIKAISMTPEHNFTTSGTMFGKIVSVKGNTLTLRPRYTTDTLDVTIADHCDIQRQVPVDPDSIKVGDLVTFWISGQQRGFRAQASTDLTAIALLPGKQTYPTVAPGAEGGQFLTGKIASLDPVLFELPDGKKVHVLIPGQMLTATLKPGAIQDLTPGAQLCVVLSRKADGGFQTQLIVLDASPFVGYGG